MSFDLLINNALVATEEKTFQGGVAVKDGKVAKVIAGSVDVLADEVIDLKGNALLPGLVDAHVHFNEPGRTHWEGYRTGTMAAAAGGVTTILDMPLNATPPTINRKNLAYKRKSVSDQAVVDYAQWGGFVDNNLEDLEDLNDDGVIGYKAFMSNSGVDFERLNDDLLYAGLKRVSEMGNVIGVHAESEYVTSYLAQELQTAGRTDRAAWFESRPPATELEAVKRACFWAKETRGNLHIVHNSIAEGIQAVAQAKQEGAQVTSETCPHYLFFDHDDYLKIGPGAKCAPPIRSRENVDALWECVLDGLVDTIGSDHSPCNWEEKEKGLDNIWKAWGGVMGVQTMLPAILTEGYHKRGLSLPAIVKMMIANPARIFGLHPKKGAIMPGSDADFTIVNLDEEWTLSVDQLFYKNKHSAYVGYSFKGKVLRTIVRGVTVFNDGQFCVQPGFGKLLRRESPYAFCG